MAVFAADVRLRADAVIFVFNRKPHLGAIRLERLFRRFNRTGQHEPDRMKKPKPGFFEFV